MTDQFIGEIRMFGGTVVPAGWALCNGQILPIIQNTALFSLIGTYYGGDGISTFALPDLTGATPIGAGAGPGLTPRTLGDRGGAAEVTLMPDELPAHTHVPQALAAAGTTPSPTGDRWAVARGRLYAATPDTTMAPAVGPAGGGQPHNNMAPLLSIAFIIALTGTFPQFS